MKKQLELAVNPQEFGIDENQAISITNGLSQILEERKTLEIQYNEIIQLDITEIKTLKLAVELRKQIKNNRTKGIETWHKTNKEFFLRGGQFVDAIKRKVIAESERMEEQLEKIEKYQALVCYGFEECMIILNSYQENLEKERLAKLQQERLSAISQYVIDTAGLDLANMTDDVWNAYFSTKKQQYQDKLELEIKLENERKAKEEADRIENERARIENDKLKKEAEEREKEVQREREEQAKKQKEIEDKLKKEAEEKTRLENEIKLQKQKELDIEKEKIEIENERKRQEKNKKFNDWLKENNYNQTTDDWIKKDDSTIELWRKVKISEIKI